MIIYIDNDFKCFVEPAEGLTEVESEFFDNKCKTLIECYRFIPDGQTWIRGDGAVFEGEMASPHTDITTALYAQAAYEEVYLNASDYVAAYNEGVESI